MKKELKSSGYGRAVNASGPSRPGGMIEGPRIGGVQRRFKDNTITKKSIYSVNRQPRYKKQAYWKYNNNQSVSSSH